MNKINAFVKVLAVAGLFTFSQAVQAQDQKPSKELRKEKAEQHFKELSTRLSLTTDQQTKVRDIMKASKVEAKSIRESSTTKEDRRPKMLALMKKTDEQINGVLDSKQQELYKQYKAEKKEKMKANRKAKSQNDDDQDEDGML